MKAGNQDSTEFQKDKASVALKEALYQAATLDPELRGKVSLDVVERLSRNPNLIRSLVRTETFTGPFPPPDILEKYNHVLPGAAERIFSLTEREQQHRHSIYSEQGNRWCAEKGSSWAMDGVWRHCSDFADCLLFC
ncbi:MAG: DUF2335 domain-containing protein [Candidatus Symbiopectobacterium sp. Dall1.0]|nr:DUF2335 domain-containing protein [Candidatus Symbiopectobacterium sp. Dall1.0]